MCKVAIEMHENSETLLEDIVSTVHLSIRQLKAKQALAHLKLKQLSFVYYTISLLATYFYAMGIFLCLSYINNHDNGELQVAPNKGEYATLNTVNNHYQSGGS